MKKREIGQIEEHYRMIWGFMCQIPKLVVRILKKNREKFMSGNVNLRQLKEYMIIKKKALSIWIIKAKAK